MHHIKYADDFVFALVTLSVHTGFMRYVYPYSWGLLLWQGGKCVVASIQSPLDKIAAILADDNFKCFFLHENDKNPIRISLKFVPMRPIDGKPTLVQVLAWRRTGDKPLPEPMLNQFTDGTRGRWVNFERCWYIRTIPNHSYVRTLY